MYLVVTRRLVSQGSDDGHTPAGANSEGNLAASENSVINIFFSKRRGWRVVSATFDVGRDDGQGSRRNLLGVTRSEDLFVNKLAFGENAWEVGCFRDNGRAASWWRGRSRRAALVRL